MRVKDGFVVREVAGQAVVIATGEASRDFHGMVKLNSTGKVIWEALAEGLSEEAIVEKLAVEYDVSSDKAAEDVAAFVAQMQEAGFIAE